jgi:hypothetical protein
VLGDTQVAERVGARLIIAAFRTELCRCLQGADGAGLVARDDLPVAALPEQRLSLSSAVVFGAKADQCVVEAGQLLAGGNPVSEEPCVQHPSSRQECLGRVADQVIQGGVEFAGITPEYRAVIGLLGPV